VLAFQLLVFLEQVNRPVYNDTVMSGLRNFFGTLVIIILNRTLCLFIVAEFATTLALLLAFSLSTDNSCIIF